MFALLSVLAALTSANAPPVQACGRAVHRLATAPPAALIVRTGCGSFEIEADGTVVPHQESWAPPWAPGATSSPGPGVYVAHPHRHLVVLRDGRTLWRSQLRHGSDGVVVHGSTIAFSVYTRGVLRPSLWMAQVGHAEFLVARSEEPVGWAAGGLLTQHGDDVRVRRADGSLGRTSLHVRSPVYDRAEDTVVMVTRSGVVIRTDGIHSWRLAKAFRQSWVTLLPNRSLEVTMGKRLLYLRPNGSPYAATPPTASSVLDLPWRDSLLYIVNTRHVGMPMGVNHVYLVHGFGRSKELYAHRVPYASCGEWASLSQANGHVLYADDEGPIAILDPTGRRPTLDLTRAFRVLQPRRSALARLNADWASNWR